MSHRGRIEPVCILSTASTPLNIDLWGSIHPWSLWLSSSFWLIVERKSHWTSLFVYFAKTLQIFIHSVNSFVWFVLFNFCFRQMFNRVQIENKLVQFSPSLLIFISARIPKKKLSQIWSLKNVSATDGKLVKMTKSCSLFTFQFEF